MNENIKNYIDNPNVCLFCGKAILPREGEKLTDTKRKKFCNSSCTAKYNNAKRKKDRFCIECGKKLTRKQRFYCSCQCQQNHKINKYISLWLNGEWNGSRDSGAISSIVRNFLIRKFDGKCEKCGEGERFDIKIPLEIHHKDGDGYNNKPENLELLCPTCHSITGNFRNKNRESVRKYRKKYN